MADKVVRMKSVDFIKHETCGDEVVLHLTGKCEGRDVRVEVPLISYAIEDVIRCLREGVAHHAERWARTQRTLGKEE